MRRPSIFRQTAALLAVWFTSVGSLAATAGEFASPYETVLPATAWVIAKVDDATSSGSGVLVDAERKLVLTNLHVVRDAPKAVVFFPHFTGGQPESSRNFYTQNLEKVGLRATVVSIDRRCDLALLELERAPASVRPISLAPESSRPSQKVMSIGNAGASGALWGYAEGVVRQLCTRQIHIGSGKVNCSMLETTCPINTGDSGGPMFNERAELIGISESYLSKANDVSLAVDVREIKEFLKRPLHNAPPALSALLETENLPYKKNAAGDFWVTIAAGDHSETVFISKAVDYFGQAEVRTIGVVAARLNERPSAERLQRLLDQNTQTIFGSWGTMPDKESGCLVVFLDRVPADLRGDELRSKLEYMARVARATRPQWLDAQAASDVGDLKLPASLEGLSLAPERLPRDGLTTALSAEQLANVLRQLHPQATIANGAAVATVRHDKWSFDIRVAMSDSATDVLVDLVLADARGLDMDRLVELMKINGQSGPAKFCVNDNSQRLALGLAIPANQYGPSRLKPAIEFLLRSAAGTATVWDRPVGPPNSGPSIVGSWSAAGPSQGKFSIDLNAEGSFTLIYQNNQRTSRSTGRYTFSNGQLTLAPEAGSSQQAQITNLTADSFDFQSQGDHSTKLAFQRGS